MGIEEEFHGEMIEIYKKVQSEYNFSSNKFITTIIERGGLKAAKILLSATSRRYGFERLVEDGRLDLTVEALVLTNKYKSLFTEQELSVAKKRLSDHR